MSREGFIYAAGGEHELKEPHGPIVEIALEFRQRFGEWPERVKNHRGEVEILGVCKRCRLPVFSDARFRRDRDGKIEHVKCGYRAESPRLLALRMLLGLQREVKG